MKRALACSALVVWLCGSWACGGDDDGGGSSGPTLEEVGPMFAAAVCGTVKKCTEGTFLSERIGGQTCIDDIDAQWEDATALEFEAAVEAGTLDYHAEGVDACLEALAQKGCALTYTRINSLDACADVFVGKVAVGGECGVDDACTGDAYCKLASDCNGVCTQRGGAGAACTSDDACKDGMSCNEAGTCEVPAQDGQPCEGTVAPDCALGFICQGADDDLKRAGTCEPYAEVFAAKENEACDIPGGKLCQAPLACVAMMAGTAATYTCLPQVASGGKCRLAIPSQCPTDEACDAMGLAEGSCQPLPKAGEACGAGMFGNPRCATGLICGSDDKCRTSGRIGDACGDDADCAGERCEAGKCAVPMDCAAK